MNSDDDEDKYRPNDDDFINHLKSIFSENKRLEERNRFLQNEFNKNLYLFRENEDLKIKIEYYKAEIKKLKKDLK